MGLYDFCQWVKREIALLWGEVLALISLLLILLALAMICEGLRICP